MVAVTNRIDNWLGNGSYKQWQELEKRRMTANQKMEACQNKLAYLHANDVSSRFLEDSMLLSKINLDLHKGMELISQGRHIDRNQADDVFDLYTLALGVVEQDVDLFESMWSSFMGVSVILFAFNMIFQHAKILQRNMILLKKELDNARKVVREAEAQMAINTTLTVIDLALPEISLLAKGGIFLGQMVSDQLLGPETAVQHAGMGTLAGGVSTFSDATKKMETLDRMPTAKFLRGGIFGAGVSVFGVTGDVDEILASYHYRDKVAALLKQIQNAYLRYRAELKKLKLPLFRLQLGFHRWKVENQSMLINISRTRKALHDDIRSTHYPQGVTPVKWHV